MAESRKKPRISTTDSTNARVMSGENSPQPRPTIVAARNHIALNADRMARFQ